MARTRSPKRLFVVFFLAAGACLAVSGAVAGDLTVVSWGGPYTQSQAEAYHKPWMARTGHRVLSEDYSGGLSEIKSQVLAGNVTWDVVDIEAAEGLLGCDEGLLEEIDPSILPPAPDGTPAEQDFPEGAISPCTIGHIVASMVFAYDRDRLSPGPTTIRDFFDLEKFPGRRGMRRSPKAALEMALVADGVLPDQVYEVLATPEGVDRAFARLDGIKEQVVWWEASSHAPQLLADGEVAMSMAYNGRIFDASELGGRSLVIVWDAQVLEIGQWAIVKGAPNRELALDFIAFASKSENMAVQASWISYAPARRTASEMIGFHHSNPELDMRPHMPTWPGNLKTVIWQDVEFWADYLDELNERFNAWLVEG